MAVLRHIDIKWAERWRKDKLFESDSEDREKLFVTFPFPYMNGPLHLGHAYSSTRVDVWARFKRMQGYNVLFPWAWHITGEPIAGAARRLAMGDEAQRRIFREVDEVPEEELEMFTSPEYMARYYIENSRSNLVELGHSIDWRREFTTTSLHEQFSRFIEWQYLTLRELGYVKKGTHPVTWCPNDESPTGDHDRLIGEGVSPNEVTLLKFKLGDSILPAATLRPETIFGVTNMWLNPEVEYVELKVDNEKWLVSREAVKKLEEQRESVEVLSRLRGEELIGKSCREPIHGREILILPASFVDPDNATGIVMSVPSHAPYDYVALEELWTRPGGVEKYGISAQQLEGIGLLSLIEVPGYGEHPAREIVENMGIETQGDERLEKATETVYREEFYKGELKDITGKYSGLKVSRAKNRLIEDFINANIADRMYELMEKVVCRCGTSCIVKILRDQWFLNYSDEGWKKRVREALAKMEIYPPEARASFENTIDWLEDKACARKTGMGTPLPWDREWKVETLSDSTVYMAFYTVAKHINLKKIPGEKLEKEVFDYIFYSRGRAEELEKRHSIKAELLEAMRREFEYFMPVDMRGSAKELIPNHLTFFIFQHVALFGEDKWPRRIAVNGMMNIEGEKMSKSKGNFITLRKALDKHGASVTRAALLYAAEDLRDPDWREKSVEDMGVHLKNMMEFVKRALKRNFREEKKSVDCWLESRLQRHILAATRGLEELRTRSALQAALFDLWKDIRWYLRREEEPSREVLFGALETWAKLISPYTPALSEELWEKLDRRGYISTAEWPSYREEKLSMAAEAGEEVTGRVLYDIDNISKVAGIEPEKVVLYAPPAWKWDVFEILSRMSKEDLKNPMAELMKRENLKKRGMEVKKLANYYAKKPERLNFTARVDELSILNGAKDFLEREVDAKVEIYPSEGAQVYDPANKRRNSLPMKPAIYLE